MEISHGILSSITPIITYCVMFIVAIAPILFFFGIRAIIAIHMNKVAKMKGHEKCHAFALCFFLGIPGYIYVVARPDMVQRQQLQNIINAVNSNKLDS